MSLLLLASILTIPSQQAAYATGPTWTADSGKALYFDGTDSSSLYVENTSHIDLSGDFTISWWQYTMAPQEGYPRIIQFGEGNDFASIFAISEEADGNTYFWYNGAHISPLATPQDNQWNHIALVRENRFCTWFVNGVIAPPDITPLIGGGDSLLGGGDPSGGSSSFCPDGIETRSSDIYIGGSSNGVGTFRGLIAGLQLFSSAHWNTDFDGDLPYGLLTPPLGVKFSLFVAGPGISDKSQAALPVHASGLKFADMTNPSRVFSYVTIRALTQTRPYNGTRSSSLIPENPAGLDAGDSLDTATCSQTFNSSAIGTRTISVSSGCKILNGEDDHTSNYEIAFVPASGEITKITPTCSVSGYSVTFDGSSHTATGTCTGLGGSVLSGLNLTNTTHSAIGTYASDSWTFTDVTGYYFPTSGTVASTISAAAPAPTPAPTVEYMPPPLPYLTTITRPRISHSGTKVTCASGTYQSGTQVGVSVRTSAAYAPPVYTFRFMNGNQELSKVQATTSSAVFEGAQLDEGAVVTCSVSVTYEGITNTDSSAGTGTDVAKALSQRDDEIKAAGQEFDAKSKSALDGFSLDSLAVMDSMAKKMSSASDAYLVALAKASKLSTMAKVVAANKSATMTNLKTQIGVISQVLKAQMTLMGQMQSSMDSAKVARESRIAKAKTSFATYVEENGYAVSGYVLKG